MKTAQKIKHLLLQSIFAELSSNTRLFVPSERDTGIDGLCTVNLYERSACSSDKISRKDTHPGRSSFKRVRDSHPAANVFREHIAP